MTTNKNLISFLEEALKVAGNGAGQSKPPETPEGDQELAILFYGMMCFDPLPDKSGYRVLFPNGLNLDGLVDIPIHAAGVWVRNRGTRAIAKWSGFAFRNDFFINDGKNQLTISGLAKTELNTDEFNGRITNLQDCGSNFKIGENPDAVIEMIVDRGTLSAHKINKAGMIVVKWTVQIEAGGPVRFTFGNDFVEIPSTVKQVFLANVSASAGEESLKHFQLYRKLAMDPTQPLVFQPPKIELEETTTLQLLEPTFGYMPPEEVTAETPNVVCSAVVSRIDTSAG